jgi:hypothetical protein
MFEISRTGSKGMNERIKELSRVAHSAADSTYAQAPDAIWLKEYNKKFAELIVRECMELTKQCSTGPGIHDLFADEIIAEHFGVEE